MIEATYRIRRRNGGNSCLFPLRGQWRHLLKPGETMDDDRPDELQTLWLVRGTLFLVVGAIVLIVAVFDSSDRPFSLLVAFAGLGFGTWDVSDGGLLHGRRQSKTSFVACASRKRRARIGNRGLGRPVDQREQGRRSRSLRRFRIILLFKLKRQRGRRSSSSRPFRGAAQ